MSRKIRIIDGREYVWVRDAVQELGLAPSSAHFTLHPKRTILFPGPPGAATGSRNLRYVEAGRLDEEKVERAAAKAKAEAKAEEETTDTPAPTTTDTFTQTKIGGYLKTILDRQDDLYDALDRVLYRLVSLEAKID